MSIATVSTGVASRCPSFSSISSSTTAAGCVTGFPMDMESGRACTSSGPFAGDFLGVRATGRLCDGGAWFWPGACADAVISAYVCNGQADTSNVTANAAVTERLHCSFMEQNQRLLIIFLIYGDSPGREILFRLVTNGKISEKKADFICWRA